MKYEISAMATTGGGAIVNCSSLSSKLALPGLGAYAAAKSGLEALTRTAAHENVGKNIRINSICAGSLETPGSIAYMRQMSSADLDSFLSRIALRRLGKVQEIAQSVLYLCSEAASFMTGSNLVIDGGYSLT
jgi:NAD(P)-dependent dehydrogenase (short-subunit alcohol dehydrogenase family)